MIISNSPNLGIIFVVPDSRILDYSQIPVHLQMSKSRRLNPRTIARASTCRLYKPTLLSRRSLPRGTPDTAVIRGTARATRSQRRARSSARGTGAAAAEAAAAASFAGQSPSSTRTLSRRTVPPCAWCVCASAECRSCCRWPGNKGTASAAPCVCGSGANDWSPASRRRGISTTPGC